MFADDPDFLARQVLGTHLTDALGVTVSATIRPTDREIENAEAGAAFGSGLSHGISRWLYRDQ
jgi:hypothetical protein